MEILLTPDQESTLKAIGATMQVYGEGEWVYVPTYFKSKGAGLYDSLRFDQLPESVKDQLLANQGVRLPEPKSESAGDWLKKQDGIIEISSYLYNFNYNGIKCAGLLTASIWGDSLRIQPLVGTDDIGEGAGCGIVKQFERN
jgi:hypothetical protein